MIKGIGSYWLLAWRVVPFSLPRFRRTWRPVKQQMWSVGDAGRQLSDAFLLRRAGIMNISDMEMPGLLAPTCFPAFVWSCQGTQDADAFRAGRAHHLSLHAPKSHRAEAFQLQAAFFQWQRARCAVDRMQLQEMKLKTPAVPEVAPVELNKVRAYLHRVAWKKTGGLLKRVLTLKIFKP